MRKAKHCTIITAYKGIEELRALLYALSDMYCFVHIDKKADSVFDTLYTEFPTVHFVRKYETVWGGYEHLAAIIELMKESLEYDWSYLHVISGEDYPVMSSSQMVEKLDACNLIFMEDQTAIGYKNQHNWWWKVYWPYVRFRWNYKNEVVRKINLCVVGVQCLLPFTWKKRIGPFEEMRRGLIWGTYPRDCVEYLVEFFNHDNSFLRDLKWCKIPEELCFPTILHNSEFKDRIQKRNLRYSRFQTPKDSGPRYINMTDIADIDSGDYLFARKVKQGTDVSDFLSQKCNAYFGST